MARRKYLDEEGLAYFWGKIKDWVNGLLTGKQDTLESGVNIKTVGGESILGEGDIPIEGGASDYEDLENKPSIGGVELVGDKGASDLGLQETISSSNKLSYNLLKDTPSIPNEASVAAWGFIKRTVSNLTNYYLKSETYTKAEVAALIAAIEPFHFLIVSELPATGAGNIIYLVGPTGTGADRYKEYVYANDEFVQIGDTSIDLSGYVTTSALNTALADYTTTANLTTLLAGKQDTISDLSTIRSGASLGATAYQKPSTGIPASDLASGVIPQPEVFWATYGTTTASEIDAAVSAGKVVMCNYNNGTYYLTNYNSSSTYIEFFRTLNFTLLYLKLNRSNDSWSYLTSYVENYISKVSTISGNETDTTKYPNTKAVADYVDGICGNILTILQSI